MYVFVALLLRASVGLGQSGRFECDHHPHLDRPFPLEAPIYLSTLLVYLSLPSVFLRPVQRASWSVGLDLARD